MSGFCSFDEVKSELRCIRLLIRVRFWCDLSIKDLNLDPELVEAIKSSGSGKSGTSAHLQNCVRLQRNCRWPFSQRSR